MNAVRNRALAPALALVLGVCSLACAGGAHRAPEPNLPELPPSGFLGAIESGPVESHAWWNDLGGDELDALVREALARNQDLQGAAARLDEAAAQARLAGAPLKPMVGAGLGGGRARNVYTGLPIPGAPGVLSSTATSVGVSLDLSWEADLWGRLRAGKRAALEDLQVAEADLEGARESLAAQVAKVWFALRESDAQLELARRTARSYGQSSESLRERYGLGLVPALDLRLALSSAANAEALVAQAEGRRELVVRQLELLLGRYPAGAVTAESGLPSVPAPPPAGLPGELVGRRPDLRAASAAVRASGLRVQVARRARFPSLVLTGGGGTASDDLADLVDLDFRVWNLAANLLAPLFHGGRIRAGIDLAEAREHEVVAAFAGRVLKALGEVEANLVLEGALEREELALHEDLEQAGAARDLAEEQYRRGLIDIVTVLESRRRALVAESRALSVRRERLDARIDLHLALGGAFDLTDSSIADEDPRS